MGTVYCFDDGSAIHVRHPLSALETIRRFYLQVEQMPNELAEIRSDRSVGLANAHPGGHPARFLSDDPTSNNRELAVKILEGDEILENEPLFAVLASR